MAAADAATIQAGTPAAVLMERAGRAVARAAIAAAGGRYGRRVALVCGKGNNGGDGFVAARALAREGVSVTCLAVGDVSSSKGAAREHLDRLRRAGIAVEGFEVVRLSDADVVVDALFGTGFRGSAEGPAAAAIEAINASGATVVAVDIPSGVDGATGRVEGQAVRADVTVAMAAEKLGTALPPGATNAGRVEVADIGIAVKETGKAMLEASDVAAALPHRAPEAHKRSGGSVAILAGSDGMTGAALLSARGAVRMGAGYATVGATSSVDAVVATVLPEVLSVVVSAKDTLGPESLERFGSVLERADALAIGPGLGRGERQKALVDAVLENCHLPTVVDADGLNVLAGDAGSLVGRRAPAVITPHPAELGRLLDMSIPEVQGDRLESARRAARELDCVVLLKGFRTVVADPSGGAFVNPTGGPELATAGTGDVLTGMVAALLAAGLESERAASVAAFVHGEAGRAAAAVHGVTGVLAWDVAEALPEAERAIRLRQDSRRRS
jgi:hydroxyethylthiazole kinase-like uncharacterized protein yjeF